MLLIGMWPNTSNGQDAATEPVIETNTEIVTADGDSISFGEMVNQILAVITANPDAQISLPDKFDPSSTDNIFQWWMFIYALVMPLGLWIIHRFWPSTTKKDLILKSTSIGIVVLLIIVFSKGASMLIIGQAVIAFIMKAFTYDKVYAAIGLQSPRKY